jgi:hypothetical protein
VRLNHFHTFRIFFSLHDNALITRQFGIRAAAANWLSSLNADLFLGLFLKERRTTTLVKGFIREKKKRSRRANL